jgi:hypothetical protein
MRELFDSRAAAAACTDLVVAHRKSRPPLPSLEELNAQRKEAVRNGATYRKGNCGMTVFSLGHLEDYRGPSSDIETESEEWTASLVAAESAMAKKRKLIPGVGFADEQNSIDL